MTLIDQLRTGSVGVRLELAEPLEILAETETWARWVDRTLALVCVAIRSRFPLDLSDARRPELRAQLEPEARRIFAREFQASEHVSKIEPRTSDPSWSPIIELELLERPGGRVMHCMHRLRYEPGREVIRGALACPIADGHVVIACMHVAQMTGWRESMLVIESGTSGLLPQAQYDAAEHDAKFPEHGLTRVRQVLQQWSSTLAITRPSTSLPAGTRVVLPASGSSIVPPVGFVAVPPGVLPMAETMSAIVRVGLEEEPDQMIDVWRIPADEVQIGNADELRVLAEEVAQAWVNEGAADVEADAWIHSKRPRSEVRCRVRFSVGGVAKLSLAHWILERDGTVHRISLSLHPPARFEDAEPTLDELVRSWEPLAPPPSKPWWKLR
jgi:hypothetical protein